MCLAGAYNSATMTKLSAPKCGTCDTVHDASVCPPPRSYGAAHHKGMAISLDLRTTLACNVRSLLDSVDGDVGELSERLGIPKWRVVRLATGDVDPTLGEIGRIAHLRNGGTLESFLHTLLECGPAHPEPVSVAQGAERLRREGNDV